MPRYRNKQELWRGTREGIRLRTTSWVAAFLGQKRNHLREHKGPCTWRAVSSSAFPEHVGEVERDGSNLGEGDGDRKQNCTMLRVLDCKV